MHRDTDVDGTEDECEFKDATGNVVNPGSRCDEFTNKCDIPLYDRKTKTIPLYFGPTATPDLFATTAQRAQLVEHRGQARGADRQVRRGDPRQLDIGQTSPGYLTSEDDLRADQQTGTTVPDVFVLCHNPVVAADSRRAAHPA